MNNREEYFRQRYVVNREAIIAQQRAYQKEHPEALKRAAARYRALHADEINERRREKYAANPEKEYRSHRAWVAKNAKTRSEYMLVWRAEKRDERKQYDSAYRKANADRRAANENARRARKIGNGGSHTYAEWLEKLEQHGHCCVYCGYGGRLTRDHDIPLNRGGRDDIENIVPACLPCNRRKHTKTGDEFRRLLDA